MFYYAIRLADGNVLRLSKTIGSIEGVFISSIPVVLIVTVLFLLPANLLARRLTVNIVRPLEYINLDGENTAVYDELIPYVKKIDEQRLEIDEQISALQNRADTITAITENMKEGLILLDKGGMVMSANKSVTHIFGHINQKSIIHICRDIDFIQGVKTCLSGMNAQMDFEREGKTYNVYFSPVHSGGAVVLFFDATSRKETERQRREFSANVSHELKTPLTSISALSEMIENGMVKNEDIKGFAARISEQVKRLIDMINDIMKLSELDEKSASLKGNSQKDFVYFDIYDLALSVVSSLSENDKGVEIEIKGERFDILANRRMIDELLYNLIDNGVKYNKYGGHVTVTLSRENEQCKIEVSDTGIGIPAEHCARVFERFYRVDKSRSKKTGGTGLGISIVKHIAEYHGGRVELSSVVGEGTTVICLIG